MPGQGHSSLPPQGRINAIGRNEPSPRSTHRETASLPRPKTAASIWNAKTGKLLNTVNHEWVLSAAFSPDGSRIVTASEDKTARIWDAKTGELILQVARIRDQVNFAEFSRPDGARIVTASSDKKARIWNANTGELLKELDGHDSSLRGAAFSPDGARVVTASDDNTARVWNAGTGEVIAVLKGHLKTVWSAAFDRMALASSPRQKTRRPAFGTPRQANSSRC